MAASALSSALLNVVPASSMPVFAHERVLPVHSALLPLFAGSASARMSDPQTTSVGLVRGQTVSCTGAAAVSCALGLVAGVTRAGSWAAIVGLPSVGVLAAAAIGVSLDRTIFVQHPDADSRADASTAGTRSDVGAALSALVDGVDLVVVSRRFLSTLSPSFVRRLQSRMQSKGSSLVVVGDPGSTSVDIRLTTHTVHWEGLGQGHGHLRRRLVAVSIDGRRCPRRCVHSVWLPDAAGGLSLADRDDVGG